MRLPATLCLGALVVGVIATEARATLSDALETYRLLRDFADARVLRIERTQSAGGANPPFFAVAFSFEQLLWLYVGESGTRVLGPAGDTWPDAGNLAARLRQIDATVDTVTIYPHPVLSPQLRDQFQLNNGCVVACVAELAALWAKQDDVRDAAMILLTYDSAEAEPAGVVFVNHALLVYRASEGWQCLDPGAPERPLALEHLAVGTALDPAVLQLALRGRYPLKSARLLPLSIDTLQRIRNSALWRTLRARPR